MLDEEEGGSRRQEGRGGRWNEEEGGTRRKEERGGRRNEEEGGTRGTRDEESEKMKKLLKNEK